VVVCRIQELTPAFGDFSPVLHSFYTPPEPLANLYGPDQMFQLQSTVRATTVHIQAHDLYSNDVVLDPFMGSGTTAVAAQEAGRSWIGYEISPEYIAVASERLGLQPEQHEPGSPEASQPNSDRDRN